LPIEEPCTGWEPNCIVPNNPEHWPIIGPLITNLTDLVGHLFFRHRGCGNGYYGFALLIVIIASIILLIRHFARKQWNKFFNYIDKKVGLK
jgi:hypothetical protein